MDSANGSEVVTYMLRAVLPSAIIITLGVLLMVFLGRQIRRLSSLKTLPPETAATLVRLIRWFIGILTFMACITVLGVKLTSVWAAVSALLAMVSIGLFAGWSLISSMLAMLIILIWRPFKVGDIIQVLPEGFSGKLEDITLMFCRIRENDGSCVTLSNSQMLQKIVRILPANQNSNEH